MKRTLVTSKKKKPLTWRLNWTKALEWMSKGQVSLSKALSHSTSVTTHDKKRQMCEPLQLEGRHSTEELTTSSRWPDPVWLKQEAAAGKGDILTRPGKPSGWRPATLTKKHFSFSSCDCAPRGLYISVGIIVALIRRLFERTVADLKISEWK